MRIQAILSYKMISVTLCTCIPVSRRLGHPCAQLHFAENVLVIRSGADGFHLVAGEYAAGGKVQATLAHL